MILLLVAFNAGRFVLHAPRKLIAIATLAAGGGLKLVQLPTGSSGFCVVQPWSVAGSPMMPLFRTKYRTLRMLPFSMVVVHGRRADRDGRADGDREHAA